MEEFKKEPSKTFVIDDRSLHKKNVSTLRAESDYYKVVFHYFGDYDEDLANGCLDMRLLSSTLYEKRYVMPLAVFRDKVFISNFQFDLINLDKVEAYLEKLEIARECGTELQGIIDKYYLADKRKVIE